MGRPPIPREGGSSLYDDLGQKYFVAAGLMRELEVRRGSSRLSGHTVGRKVCARFGVLVCMTYYAKSLRKSASLLFVPAAVALVIAGCGGGGGTTASTTGTGAAAAKTPAASGPTLKLASLEPGKALVDAQGRTLYLFEADKGDKSTCNGACASIWPPATVTGAPKAGPGLTASEIGTTKRSDGASQLTYNGHPLYRYAADTKPGEDNGQALDQFGAEWYVLNAHGTKIDDD